MENLIFGEEKERIKLQERYNKMNVIIKQYFGKCMTTDLKLRLHNITLKAALFYGGETWAKHKTTSKKWTQHCDLQQRTIREASTSNTDWKQATQYKIWKHTKLVGPPARNGHKPTRKLAPQYQPMGWQDMAWTR